MTKAIAHVDKKIDYYMVQRQIVKALGRYIDIEDPIYTKYARVQSFHS